MSRRSDFGADSSDVVACSTQLLHWAVAHYELDLVTATTLDGIDHHSALCICQHETLSSILTRQLLYMDMT